MKIIHFSDIHIHDQLILGQNSINRFQIALKHMCNNHLDSDLFVISGDLTHQGQLQCYKKLKEILEKAKLPMHLFPKLILGNHDDREVFKNFFTNVPIDENGFVHYENDFNSKRFIFLDTNLPKTHQGHYCEKRLKWLINKLELATKEGKGVYLFMHHNPLAMAKEDADYLGIQQKDKLKKIFIQFSKIIKHIFFGHQHLSVSGNIVGISFSAPTSICHPLVTNYDNKYRLGTANTEPNYNVILIKDDSLIVHTENFLNTDINWFETTQED
jgi:3',5'-cyclic AMP phosphodiesterase CpdA